MKRLRMVRLALCCSGWMLSLLNSGLGYAALPDQETYEFVLSKYSTLLEETRSGCGYYANLNTLSVDGDQRTVSVLLTRGPSGGTACNGVFEFQVLGVRCQSQEISYSERLASPANWQESWYSNAEVAEQVCSLPPPAAGRPVHP